MTEFDSDSVQVVACDIFGTTVDWFTGVSEQAAAEFRSAGVDLDAGVFANEWRDMYLPAMQRVRDGERSWAYLDTLHRESLDVLLDRHGVVLDEAARARLVLAWHLLPAWPDAFAGLGRLRERYTLAALSNGGFALLTRMIKNEGLPFDCLVSAELARTYKPAPEVYRTAASLLDVDPGRVLMVAAHTWDIDGARAAGLRTAFLERPDEKGPHRKADRPEETRSDLTAASFFELADLLGC
ncbi:haloacid dehalogenase type II [Nocardia mexicana]|uniref:2-haloacid dehalogenase n=1 Tax=Nocardia mexicana TaxID=279262 RepID=A0A370H8B3_9NOCA|nr:haloacid dehalogenase type II [Nocardia mexicana]RDI50571.1 2-haloacid dehalogenase [Nocardia mexicana]